MGEIGDDLVWFPENLERRFAGAASAADMLSLLQRFPSAAAVGIDMPIGFPATEPRRADSAARPFVGAWRSSGFSMLPKLAYQTDSYAEASVVCKKLSGKGLWGLFASATAGGFLDVIWINGAQTTDEIDAANLKLQGDPAYVGMIDRAGDMFIHGSARRSVLMQLP